MKQQMGNEGFGMIIHNTIWLMKYNRTYKYTGISEGDS